MHCLAAIRLAGLQITNRELISVELIMLHALFINRFVIAVLIYFFMLCTCVYYFASGKGAAYCDQRLSVCLLAYLNKKLSYCRGTARRAMLVHSCYVLRAISYKGFKQHKLPSRSFKGIGNGAIR